MDGRPNPKNKVMSSNFSGVVCARPQCSCFLSIANHTKVKTAKITHCLVNTL